MSHRHLLPVVAAAALLAGCGSSGGDPDADPAALVPERAPVYLEADLKPEGDQEDAVKALSEKLGGTSEPGAELKKLIEREMKEDDPDFSFEEDVEPWLGDRIAVFVTDISVEGTVPNAQAAFIAPSKDVDKARDTLEAELSSRDRGEPAPRVVERTHRDVKYKVETNDDTAVAIVDDYVVFGNDRGVKAAIDAREGKSLASADAYKDARAEVAEDGLGIVYVGTQQLLSALGPQGAALRPVLGQAGRSLAVALDPEEDAIRLESAAIGVQGPAARGDVGRLIGELPSTAWTAFGTPDVGGQIDRVLRQFGQLGAFGGFDLEQLLTGLERQTGIDVREDLLSWMGDAAVFVEGQALSDVGGALVVRSKDAAKTRAVVPRLGRLLRSFADGVSVRRLAPSVADGVDAGLTLRFAELPLPVHVAAAGDRFVVAVTDGSLRSALDPETPLGASTRFREAAQRLGGDVRPSLFLDLDILWALVSSAGVQGAEAEQVQRVLGKLTTVAAGSAREGEIQRGRVVVGVK